MRGYGRYLSHYTNKLLILISRFLGTVSAQLEARASIFRSGFLGGPLIKFIIPGLLIKQVDIVKCFFRFYIKYIVIWHTYATY